MKHAAALAPVAVLLLSATIYWHATSVPVSDFKTHLSNKVVLLCDATSGLGELLAYELASQGANMVLVAREGRSEALLYALRDGKLASPQAELQISIRTEPVLRKIKAKSLELGSPRVELLSIDFGNVTGVSTLVDATVDMMGALDYLVLNHAETPRGSFLNIKHQQTPEFINRSFGVNVFSFIELALRAMPHLEKSKGHIFVTSSTLGEVPDASSTLSVFSATKHALNGFFYSLQQELLAKKSSVTISIGALGGLVTGKTMPLFKLPDWMMGDLTECAHGMMEALVTRPRTFTYPKIHPYLARFVWYFQSK